MTPTIKEFFGKSRKTLNELLIESISELGKHYSRLELAYNKLAKRDKELFDECVSCLNRGMKNRAAVYANEIAELRKIMSIIHGMMLSIEKAILRLETFRTVAPTLDDIKGVFSEVKSTLGDVAKAMPSLTPEISSLVNSINDLLAATEISSIQQEPIVIKDEATEAILKEASDFLRQEIERRIPEPPEEQYLPEPPQAAAVKPRVAIAVDGSEAYVDEDGSIIEVRSNSPSPLMEDLVLDYIERNNGEMNISKCAQELKIPPDKIKSILNSLCRRGRIKIE